MSIYTEGPHRKEGGLTIVELLIAITVFSIVLLLITTAIMQFSRQYYKSVHASAAQAVARNAIDSISQAVQFGSLGSNIEPTSAGNPLNEYQHFCAGGYEYKYKIGQKYGTSVAISASNPGLYVVPNNDSSCTAGAFSGGKQLLSNNMRVSELDISKSGELFTISIAIAYGDDDLLTDSNSGDVKCGTDAGNEYCAVSKLSTKVMRRVP